MGYIIGLVVIAHIVGAIILLLYGLVTDPINTIFIVALIHIAALMVFLFFMGQYGLFWLLNRLGCVDGDWIDGWHWRHRRK